MYTPIYVHKQIYTHIYVLYIYIEIYIQPTGAVYILKPLCGYNSPANRTSSLSSDDECLCLSDTCSGHFPPL